MLKHHRLVVFVLVALGILVLSFGLILGARQASLDRPFEKTELPSAAISTADGLKARITLEAMVLPVEVPMRLWLTVSNEGDQPRRGLELERLELRGLEAAELGDCWKVAGGIEVPACLANSPTGAVHTWPLDLDTGKSVTFWALVTASEPGNAQVEARILAPPPQGSANPSASLVLEGPSVRVTGGWFTPAHVKSLLDLFGNLALPIVLAILAFILKRHSETEARRHEAARDEEARRHEVWRQMLPRVHENAQKYYMPVSGAICALRRRFDKLVKVREEREKAPAADDAALEAKQVDLEDRLFFHLVMVFVRMGALLRDIGGYYFQNEEGEWMAHHLWHVFRERCYGGNLQLYADFELLADRIAPEESIAAFNTRFEPRPIDDSATASNGFAEWILDRVFPSYLPRTDRGDHEAAREALGRIHRWFEVWLIREVQEERDLCLLRMLEDVFDYEMNVPYRLWYGKSTAEAEVQAERQKHFGQCREWLERLGQKAAEDDTAFAELKDHADKYLRLPEGPPNFKAQRKTAAEAAVNLQS